MAWEEAKARGGVTGGGAQRTLPDYCRDCSGCHVRQATLIGEFFHRQTLGVFEPTLHVEYLVLDFGGRGGAIDLAKANLLVSDLAFNDTHRKIIFRSCIGVLSLAECRRPARGSRSQPEKRPNGGRGCAKPAEQWAGDKARSIEATPPEPNPIMICRRLSAPKTLLAATSRRPWVSAGNNDSRCRPSANSPRRRPWPILSTRISIGLLRSGQIYWRRWPVCAQPMHPSNRHGPPYFPTLSFSGDGGLARAYGQQDCSRAIMLRERSGPSASTEVDAL